MKFSRLYKLTSTGALQYWDIEVMGTDIVTIYGQLGSSRPQKTIDTVSSGKNIGKLNETTPEQQAIAEATSRWTKKKKSGYVDSLEAAENGKVDSVIEGGIPPMLAHSFSKHGHKIEYPAYVSPKLDGIRLIAVIDNGKCTLWSRTRKQIRSLPHIVESLEYRFKGSVILDGEAYNHSFRNNFEKIISIVRQESPANDCTLVEFHIFDWLFPPSQSTNNKYFSMPYRKRLDTLVNWQLDFVPHLLVVPSSCVGSQDEAIDKFNEYRSLGYEGAMIRNSDGLYVFKRSYDLLKIKEFEDEEFPIVGVEEGRGKLSGHVGAFICQTPSQTFFRVKMSGELNNLRLYWENHDLWKGKLLTVQHQGYTSTDNVPRFPVGVRFRDSLEI